MPLCTSLFNLLRRPIIKVTVLVALQTIQCLLFPPPKRNMQNKTASDRVHYSQFSALLKYFHHTPSRRSSMSDHRLTQAGSVAGSVSLFMLFISL